MKPLNYTDELIFASIILLSLALFIFICKWYIAKRLNEVLSDENQTVRNKLMLKTTLLHNANEELAQSEKLIIELSKFKEASESVLNAQDKFISDFVKNIEVIEPVFESGKPL